MAIKLRRDSLSNTSNTTINLKLINMSNLSRKDSKPGSKLQVTSLLRKKTIFWLNYKIKNASSDNIETNHTVLYLVYPFWLFKNDGVR